MDEDRIEHVVTVRQSNCEPQHSLPWLFGLVGSRVAIMPGNGYNEPMSDLATALPEVPVGSTYALQFLPPPPRSAAAAVTAPTFLPPPLIQSSQLPEAQPTEFPADDIDAMIARAEGTLMRVLASGRSAACAYSGGKDSSVVLNLLLSAAVKLKATGVNLPTIAVLHGDTLVENPDVHGYVRDEMQRITSFAKRHDLPVVIRVAYPSLVKSWAVRCIGGTGLNPHVTTGRDCTEDWKINPQTKERKALLQQLQPTPETPEAVVLLGTRHEESSARSANMRERGESDSEIRRGTEERKLKDKAGNPVIDPLTGKPAVKVVETDLFLSPIAQWTSDDVWMYLSMAQNGLIPAYSDFKDTFRIYTAATSASCVLHADRLAEAARKSRACGARTGCWSCGIAQDDKSMENMLQNEPERYGYMAGLNRLRNFMVNIHYDYSRRSWLGRSIDKNGYIAIGPDAYSPQTMENLLRYALTIDEEERDAANRLGIAPRFRIVDDLTLFTIDAYWSLQAFHRPFHALAIWRDVVRDGKRYPVPDVPCAPKTPLPATRYLFVGRNWDENDNGRFTGLRDFRLEMVKHDADGCPGNRVLKDGTEVLDIGTSAMFSIEMEYAYFLLYDELDDLLARYHDDPRWDGTAAYRHYALLGLLSVRPGQERKIDEILRRSAFKHRHGFAGQIDPARLIEKSVSATEANPKPKAKRNRKRGKEGSKSVLVEDLRQATGVPPTSSANDSHPLPKAA